MFRTNDVAARRAGMLAAGLALLAGDGLLLAGVLGLAFDGPHAPPMFQIVVLTWLAAVAVGAGTYAMIRHTPRLQVQPVRASVALAVPAVGVALCLPITIHLLVFALLREPVREFNEWAPLAIAFTAIAHIGFAWQVGIRAVQLANGDDAISVKRIFGTAVALSCIPGVVLFLLPPLVVALTGLPILPLLHYMERYAERDRAAPWVPAARVLA